MSERPVDLTSEERDASAGFPLVGGTLALDFVNTAIVVRGRPRDLLATPEDFARWQQAAGEIDPVHGLEMNGLHYAMDEAMLSRIKAFRTALRGLFSAVASGGLVAYTDLESLNRVLRAGFLTVEADALGRFWQRSSSHDPGPDGTLLPIARSAMALLTKSDLSRLHHCANERCVLLFYDTTKSGTRRWCSTGCMNRARSSRRYRERRASLAEAMDA